MTKVLMVCLGNICRSPLAEGILKSMVDLKNIAVDSAGTGGYHVGSLPDPRSIEVARKNGLDITDQRARKFKPKDFEDFDLIYAMDESNYLNIIALANNESEKLKVKLLLKEVDLGIHEVPDPYYGGPNGFDAVFEMIHEACQAVSSNLVDNGR
ncbi:low molecular weight protein-tyrosine-phosphatase [Croceivirga thetidis]|uniref:protein-tyrosine-phosphatase n=1 Tax=Croceivirga thetidis TaxID=2721623 RepID=A0ABX1GUA1_9FLAO|nr:low molecular weight protein-tyrosine-phosphatase [Croceivirga thetidis]NKI32575.1 low molecular weight phosphotyrosine protein phosphatase [Croceivirga thetidis]